MSRSSGASVPFGRTTTEKRFVVAFGTVFVVLGFGAYLTLRGLHELHSMMHESVATARALDVGHQLQCEVLSMHAHRTHSELFGEDESEALQRLDGALDRDLKDARVSLGPSGSALVGEVESMRRDLGKSSMDDGGAGRDASRALHRQRLDRIQAMRRTFASYSRSVAERLEAFEDHASAVAHSGFRNALVLLLGASVLTLTIGLALGRSIAKPLAILHSGARRIAGGDLHAQIDIEGPREFRELAAQLNHMVVATRENQERLIESERLASVGRLAAGIAHEINNPLGVIRGYVKLARNRSEDPELRADLQVIEDECVRCHTIVRELLTLARPAVDSAAEVPLRDMIEELVERLAEAGEGRSERVTVTGDGMVWGNNRTLRQVLLNLLDNAFFASEPDGRVHVAIRSADSGGVTVEIVDDGEGLPDGGADAVFEPFFTTKPSGTGLGLAVSRAIARAHGGDLVAENASGGGALFRLTLPARAEERL